MFEIEIEKLTENLRGTTPVYFSFLKKNGEVRNALGTINPKLIPDEFQLDIAPTDASFKQIHKKRSTNVKYFDLEKNGWRSISYDVSIVSILE